MKRHWLCVVIAAAAAVAISASGITSLAAADEAQKAPEQKPADQKSEETYSIKVAHMVDPVYPKDAVKDGAEGMVLLKLTLNGDGSLADLAVVQGVEGYPSFSEAALEAVRQWGFEVTGDVDPEEVLEIMVPIQFKLDGSKTREISVRVPDAKADSGEASGSGEEQPAE